MHGSKLAVVVVVLGLGCRDGRPRKELPAVSVLPGELAVAFDPAATGDIRGSVTWTGPPPVVPAFQIHGNYEFPVTQTKPSTWPNPLAPNIDAASAGVRDAVVYLRQVDPKKSKPWQHPPAVVAMQNHQLKIAGKGIGFARLGATLTLVNEDAIFHSVQARGAAFFALPFPDAGKPSVRQLHKKGVIELSSGAGFYWMRAFVFVDDHPYYAATDEQGRFQMSQVPAGTYQIVCWLPNWHVLRHERNPETALITQVAFAPALEQEREIIIQAGETARVDFTLDVKE